MTISTPRTTSSREEQRQGTVSVDHELTSDNGGVVASSTTGAVDVDIEGDIDVADRYSAFNFGNATVTVDLIDDILRSKNAIIAHRPQVLAVTAPVISPRRAMSSGDVGIRLCAWTTKAT